MLVVGVIVCIVIVVAVCAYVCALASSLCVCVFVYVWRQAGGGAGLACLLLDRLVGWHAGCMLAGRLHAVCCLAACLHAAGWRWLLARRCARLWLSLHSLGPLAPRGCCCCYSTA